MGAAPTKTNTSPRTVETSVVKDLTAELTSGDTDPAEIAALHAALGAAAQRQRQDRMRNTLRQLCLQETKDIFNKYDIDNSGGLDEGELAQAITDMYNTAEQEAISQEGRNEAKVVMEKSDKDGNLQVDVAELEEYMHGAEGAAARRRALEAAEAVEAAITPYSPNARLKNGPRHTALQAAAAKKSLAEPTIEEAHRVNGMLEDSQSERLGDGVHVEQLLEPEPEPEPERF